MAAEPEPSAAPRRVWRSYLAGGLILLSGIVIGFGLGVRVERLREPFPIMAPEAVPNRLAQLMRRELGLSAEQAEKVKAIFLASRGEIDVVRSKILPEMDAILESTREKVSQVLTPEQAAAWNAKFAELRNKWRPKPAASSIN